MMGSLMFAMQQVAPPIESVFPFTVGGWVGMLTGIAALSILIYDRLRGSGKLDADLHNTVNDLERKASRSEHESSDTALQLATLERKLSEVGYELRGVDGQNGVKGLNRTHGVEIATIKKRLADMDVIAALFKAERSVYGGEEKRHFTRRSLDAKLAELAQPADDDDGN